MDHLLYLMFRCDGDVMKNLEILWELNTAQAHGVCSSKISHSKLHYSPITSNMLPNA